jgi:23S rRNA-/tRNA-specific pseudouridylate synthase
LNEKNISVLTGQKDKKIKEIKKQEIEKMIIYEDENRIARNKPA